MKTGITWRDIELSKRNDNKTVARYLSKRIVINKHARSRCIQRLLNAEQHKKDIAAGNHIRWLAKRMFDILPDHLGIGTCKYISKDITYVVRYDGNETTLITLYKNN